MNRWFDKLPLIGGKIPGKITLSFIMFLFSVGLYSIFKTTDRGFCIIAMLFSFIGDISLNYNPNHDKQSKKAFIVGGIAFIFAHIFYCITYYQKIMENKFELFNMGSIFAIAVLVFVTVLAMVLNQQSSSKLFAFILIYIWVTGINYITIFSYAFSAKSIESLIILGSLLFLTSDVIIGLEKITGLKSKIARELVWWFYPIGQIILIAMA